MDGPRTVVPRVFAVVETAPPAPHSRGQHFDFAGQLSSVLQHPLDLLRLPLGDGDLPLCLQFSGTVFYQDSEGGLQVAPISWEREAHFRLPVSAWREVMKVHYPNSAWLCLRRDVFDRLQAHKTGRGMLTWEQAIEELLLAAPGGVRT